ncbi:flagellar basal body rod protein FlgC [Lysinibacillus sphaericus]|uniref:Flagellar basal-body rod protein FlgC n=4 Tax=Lysinibacillus TaxID=400634 RepID=A0A2S0K3V6_LYSSH|nr:MULTISPECIES: flagellar basal body rod protein FlgC [Lysinibacillus]AHN20910.1 flagellar basal body rod protein FlgC [Lysinibacillus varians]AVK98018.1 flagellar basal body rod protein FlgC [Lysinibacillus sphaericus]MCS1380834.1 flagellar basal body rod protein FlgC [Lysinibacillus sphaericus]MED4543519.1 flagellar basal body rod protein FlgC [Lysinibacillus sphaericus]TKI19013.1 flagellar basal body rod protein FlgC [Lysinibacillus sphaericus]
MSIFHGMNTTASALTAQRLRMDVISSNMANMDTTRAKQVNGEWEPYRRKSVTFSAQEGQFSKFLNVALGKNAKGGVGNGVKVSQIKEDTETPFKLVYDPTHPDANAEGYVNMPNVDPLKEMVDLMSATRSYEANITVLNANKSMLTKALEIGK